MMIEKMRGERKKSESFREREREREMKKNLDKKSRPL